MWDRVARVARYARQSLGDVRAMSVGDFVALYEATHRLLEVENTPGED